MLKSLLLSKRGESIAFTGSAIYSNDKRYNNIKFALWVLAAEEVRWKDCWNIKTDRTTLGR